MEEHLLGFDAREISLAPLPEAYTCTYLLRQDVRTVFSADRLIWPSLFHDSFLPATRPAALERPPWIGANEPFWEELPALEAAIPAGPCWIIAATWHSNQGSRTKAGELGPHRTPTNPEHRNPYWRFLGFDVTDGSFLSGLSNCGYDAAQRPSLVRQWAPFLNDHHLFNDPEKALEFSAVSNDRVREHAPFCVIGLWVVREVG